MNQRITHMAIPALRWVLGLLLIVESARLALSPAAAHEVTKLGLPQWLPGVLGGSEAVAALLFLIPATRVPGGYALLGVLAIAVLIHLLHGQYDVGVLLVYAMAVIVCTAHPS